MTDSPRGAGLVSQWQAQWPGPGCSRPETAQSGTDIRQLLSDSAALPAHSKLPPTTPRAQRSEATPLLPHRTLRAGTASRRLPGSLPHRQLPSGAWAAEPREPVTERDRAGRWQQGEQHLGVWLPSLRGGERLLSPHCSRSRITGDCQPRVALDGVMKTRQWPATPQGSHYHRWC